MNLPSSMCAHLLVQPLVPTSITTTLLVGGRGLGVVGVDERASVFLGIYSQLTVETVDCCSGWGE